MPPTAASPSATPKAGAACDVVVIGDGVVGLSTALELARAGLRCHVLGARQPGAASSAAAGILAPNIGVMTSDLRALFRASLALYPEYLAPLQTIDPGLKLLSGLIEVLHEHSLVDDHHLQLEQRTLDTLQPGVLAPYGAVLHETDAAIDSVRLVAVLRRAIELQHQVTYVTDDAVSISPRSGSVSVKTRSGASVEAATAVVAAGAWSSNIDGLPRALPVRPLKGEMLSLGASVLTRPVMAGHVYLVPRGDETIVGATSEEAGFDTVVHAETVESLHRSASALVPALLSAPIARTWAGIRPATPDLLPIIDRDPDEPCVVYAVGHSRNGILLAPLTAVSVSELVQGQTPSFDIRPFSVGRFARERRP